MNFRDTSLGVQRTKTERNLHPNFFLICSLLNQEQFGLILKFRTKYQILACSIGTHFQH